MSETPTATPEQRSLVSYLIQHVLNINRTDRDNRDALRAVLADSKARQAEQEAHAKEAGEALADRDAAQMEAARLTARVAQLEAENAALTRERDGLQDFLPTRCGALLEQARAENARLRETLDDMTQYRAAAKLETEELRAEIARLMFPLRDHRKPAATSEGGETR